VVRGGAEEIVIGSHCKSAWERWTLSCPRTRWRPPAPTGNS